MRFLMTFHAKDTTPNPEKIAAIGAFSEEMAKSGILLDTGGILPLSQGARVRQDHGKFAIVDGPFPETKELIVGYAIIAVKSREEAIEVSRKFMAIAGDGEGDIQQLMGPQDMDPTCAEGTPQSFRR